MPERLTAHGIDRVDDYAWLRDPNWRAVMQDPSVLAPQIRAYIEAENSYAEAILAPLAGLRAKLIEELKGRIDPADSGVRCALRCLFLLEVRARRRAISARARAERRAGRRNLLDLALALGRQVLLFGEYRHKFPTIGCSPISPTKPVPKVSSLRSLIRQRRPPEAIADVADVAWRGQHDALCNSTRASRASSTGTAPGPTRTTARSRRRSWRRGRSASRAPSCFVLITGSPTVEGFDRRQPNRAGPDRPARAELALSVDDCDQLVISTN
jgi:hypothetical protein